MKKLMAVAFRFNHSIPGIEECYFPNKEMANDWIEYRKSKGEEWLCKKFKFNVEVEK